MSFTPRFLDEIRTRVGLADRIGRKVKLSKRGREYSGLCPFHNEKTPSFTVNEDKGFYHCFGCGAHGDVIGFVMRTENFSFPEAVECLADEVGLEVPASSPEERRQAEQVVSLYSVSENACAWFESALKSPSGAGARDYLSRRGLDEEAIARFRIGYAVDSRGRLKTALTGGGVTESLLVTAGLLVVPEDGRVSYDRFRGRVIFPIFDRRGRPVAFGGRILNDGTPKYLNSPDTPLFQKGQLLYGWSHALKGARETGTLVVCEGYIDVISLIRAGIAAMAPLGTALTEAQILSLWRVVPEPVLSFDGDAAGARAAMRAAERALPLLKPGCSFRFVTLPRGEDPDSLVRARGTRGMESLISSARPMADVIWDMETRGRPVDTPERRAAVEKGLMNRAYTIADKQVQEYYLRDFRRRLYEAFADFSPVAGARKRSPGAGLGLGGAHRRLASDPLIGSQDGSAEARERVLVTTILNHPDMLDEIAEEFTGAMIGSNELNSLRQAILDVVIAKQSMDATTLASELATLGFERLVEGLVGPRAQLLDWFARPDATRDDALSGFRHTLELHRRFGVGQAELDACESAFAEDPSEDNWARLQAVKSELQTVLSHEGRQEYHSVPVKDAKDA